MKVLTTCALGVAFGLAAFAEEAKVNVQDLPAAVQTAVKAQTNDSRRQQRTRTRAHDV